MKNTLHYFILLLLVTTLAACTNMPSAATNGKTYGNELIIGMESEADVLDPTGLAVG